MNRAIMEMIKEINPFISEISFDYPLIENGVLDSIQVYSLLVRIELEMDVEFPAQFINKETFQTINTIAATIEKLQRGDICNA